ncbi:hypothetical protein D046_8347B, partial [Vibrio parahaemolyticus V-223/04]
KTQQTTFDPLFRLHFEYGGR